MSHLEGRLPLSRVDRAASASPPPNASSKKAPTSSSPVAGNPNWPMPEPKSGKRNSGAGRRDQHGRPRPALRDGQSLEGCCRYRGRECRFQEHAQIFDLSEAHYDKTMDTNVKVVVFTVQEALPLMTRGGSIVVVSSVVNVKGIPAHGTYTAAKAGVRALVRVWAQELKGKGIRVNTLSPGAAETPKIRGQFDSDAASDAAKTAFASMTPLGRLGLAEEIAAGAYFLASGESSYVTAIDLPVDGGLAQV